MDRFEAMTMLLEVVKTGSLSAAARSLRVPLPTLSRKISDLETRLATRLLIRTTRSLSLTDAGIGYVAAARRILEQVDDAEREAAGEFATPKGELVISAPIHFGRLHVLPVIADFLELFPAISVRLMLTDRNVDLVDDHVDMAVRIGRLPDSGMVATQVGAMRTVVCASPALLAGQGELQRPEDLQGFPCITTSVPILSPSWRLYSPETKEPQDIPIVPRLSVTTTEAAVDAAIRGIGATRLFYYQVAQAVESGALKLVLESFEREPSPIHLLHASRGQMPLKMRRFLDFAVPRLRLVTEKIAAASTRA